MADNNKRFFDTLKEFLDDFEEIIRNENDTNDHDSQINSSLDVERNFSTSTFNLETGVSSSLATPFSIPGCGNSHGVSASGSVAGAQRGSSEAPEENLANFFLIPVETATGDFRPTDDTQSNPTENSSYQHNIGGRYRWRLPWKRLSHASFGAEDGTCRKKQSKVKEYFPQRKRNPLVSAWPPQISVERHRNEAMAQTKEDYRKLSSTSAIFSPKVDISSIKVNTSRTPLDSVTTAKAVSVAGPSGIQTQSRETGKEKRFKCEICGKTYGYRQNLWQHKKKHTGKNPFKCSTCGKGFDEQNHLEKHLMVHSVERPHECTKCHKRFKMKHHLVTHLRTHTTCDLCDEEFSHNRELKAHLRWHTGQEPHQCEVCRRYFASKTNCIEHQRTEHGWK